MKKIETYVLGNLQVNTYILWNDNHVLIIDPGSKSKKLQSVLDDANAIVDGIVLTHGHCDHIAGVDAFASKYNAKVYIHEYDLPLLSDANLNLSNYMGEGFVVKSKAECLEEGKCTIGNFTFEFILASGHSEGSAMLIWDNYLICGDVLFQGSIGRTDFFTSSNTKMYQSLQLIKTLNPDLIVLPGHGPKTTLLQELNTNPYLIN